MTGGMIVRLIDVVFIILFGFIAISDIQMKRQIRLPGPLQEKKQQEQKDILFIFVHVDTRGQFTVKLEERKLFNTTSLSQLKVNLVKAVLAARIEGKSPVIIIDPDPDATMQRTIDVFDICEETGLPKSINMQLKSS